MLTWASILAALVKLAGAVMTWVNNRQLMDAGRAVERDRYTEAEREKLDAAMRARVDAGGVPDTFDRANRR